MYKFLILRDYGFDPTNFISAYEIIAHCVLWDDPHTLVMVKVVDECYDTLFLLGGKHSGLDEHGLSLFLRARKPIDYVQVGRLEKDRTSIIDINDPEHKYDVILYESAEYSTIQEVIDRTPLYDTLTSMGDDSNNFLYKLNEYCEITLDPRFSKRLLSLRVVNDHDKNVYSFLLKQVERSESVLKEYIYMSMVFKTVFEGDDTMMLSMCLEDGSRAFLYCMSVGKKIDTRLRESIMLYYGDNSTEVQLYDQLKEI